MYTYSVIQQTKGIDNVLKLIREKPEGIVDYCSILIVGSTYKRKGMDVKFLENRKTEFYDLEINSRIGVEVKRLELLWEGRKKFAL